MTIAWLSRSGAAALPIDNSRYDPKAGKISARWAVAAWFALVVLLATACSGGGGTSTVGLPDPAPGKVAAFAWGKLSKKYDLSDTAVHTFGLVTADGAGDVYLVNTAYQSSYLFRMTPRGEVTSSAERVNVSGAGAMVARDDGSVVLGTSRRGADSLPAYSRDGAPEYVPIPASFDAPQPVGERPDGSLVVTERGNFWAVKGGKATLLYHQSKTVKRSAVVDGEGTLYTVPGTLGDIVAVTSDGKRSHVRVTGKEPVTGQSLAGFDPVDMAPAGNGGFYVIAENAAISEYVLIHVVGRSATVMVRQPIASGGCAAGGQYPALHSACEPQTCVVQSGGLVLLMCNLTAPGGGKPQPALALKPTAS